MLPSMGTRFSNDVGMGGGGIGSVFAPNPRRPQPQPVWGGIRTASSSPTIGTGGGTSPVQAPVQSGPQPQPVNRGPMSMFAPRGRTVL